MTQITVKGFAEQIGITPDILLRQLSEAGVEVKQVEDTLSDEEKEKQFQFLRSTHGADDEGGKKKITLKRKSTTQVVQSTRTGSTRTVQVEVRKKRTFVKRAAADETPAVAEEAEVVPET